MQVPSSVLSVALWAAVIVVGVAAGGLLAVLIREWRNGRLW